MTESEWDRLLKIRTSGRDDSREMLLFFYYPSDEYVSTLMTVDELEFLDDIDCMDLFPGEDPREKILIFRVGIDPGEGTTFLLNLRQNKVFL